MENFNMYQTGGLKELEAKFDKKIESLAQVMGKVVSALTEKANQDNFSIPKDTEYNTPAKILEFGKELAQKRYGGHIGRIWNTKFELVGVTVSVIPFVGQKGKWKGKLCLKVIPETILQE